MTDLAALKARNVQRWHDMHLPEGRGPFLDHADDVTSGRDADPLRARRADQCAPHAAMWSDWTAGGVMTLFEEYNGLDYAAMGVPSAYVWSGTDQSLLNLAND